MGVLWEKAMLKWMRSLFVSSVPAPAIGQVWLSNHSGRCIRIADVRLTDTGGMSLVIQHEQENSWNEHEGLWYRNRRFSPIKALYTLGVIEWNKMIQNERRELV
jgi:hypothetical protein